jgi:hypothetical protein
MTRRPSPIASAVALAAAASFWSPPTQAVDPTTADCLAASEVSLKLGNAHRLRAERSQLLVCAAPSCPVDIRKECLRRVDEVNAAIPTLVFDVKDGSGADLSAVKVTVDGEVLAERIEGTPLSVDPGEHSFVFETPGQPTVTRRLVIRESEKDRREPITFGSSGAPASPAQPASPAIAPPPAVTTEPLATAPPPAPAPRGMGTRRVVALAVGGLGVVGLGVGTALGLSAKSSNDDANSICPNTMCASQDAVDKSKSAAQKGNIATAAFIVGGLGIGAGVVLWLTGAPAPAQVGIGPTSVDLRMSW